MQLQKIQPIHKAKKEKRIGRGGKKGTYCGRGIKGQKSRAGRKLKPIVKEVLKKYPKLRGYRFAAKKKYLIVNLRDLEKKFQTGEKVSPQILVEKRVIRKVSGEVPKVKILSKGEISKALIFENCLFSKKAKEKIEKAGGKIL